MVVRWGCLYGCIVHGDTCGHAGMLVGGFLWGSLADALGRKVTLLTAMLLNGVCGFVSAFSPNFFFFLTFRFISGIG